MQNSRGHGARRSSPREKIAVLVAPMRHLKNSPVLSSILSVNVVAEISRRILIAGDEGKPIAPGRASVWQGFLGMKRLSSGGALSILGAFHWLRRGLHFVCAVAGVVRYFVGGVRDVEAGCTVLHS